MPRLDRVGARAPRRDHARAPRARDARRPGARLRHARPLPGDVRQRRLPRRRPPTCAAPSTTFTRERYGQAPRLPRRASSRRPVPCRGAARECRCETPPLPHPPQRLRCSVWARVATRRGVAGRGGRSFVRVKRWGCVGAATAAWIAGCGSSNAPAPEVTRVTSSAIQAGATDTTHDVRRRHGAGQPGHHRVLLWRPARAEPRGDGPPLRRADSRHPR